MKAGDRVGVAVSGGADSVALLRLLLELRGELGVVLSVVHFNHQLRGGESDEDERFVGALAAKHGLEFFCDRGDVKALAKAKHLSLEAAARAARYEYFRRLLEERVAESVATAHTLDDQAETVLLRVVRGAGNKGLAGIYRKLRVGAGSNADARLVIRPLLGTRRGEVEDYLGNIGQDWREDASNRDLRHARNRVRHGVLPRLERNLNPEVREALAETAEIAQAEEEYWRRKISRQLPRFWEAKDGAGGGEAGGRLKCDLPKSLAVRRRMILAAVETLGLKLEFKHVKEVIELAAAGNRNGATALPKGWTVRREKDELEFVPPFEKRETADYEYSLKVPGSVEVPEIGARFEAVMVDGAGDDVSFDAKALGKELTVRNWRAGDRFWPAHTKSEKKVKELLAERRIAGAEKRAWPVIANGTQIVWVRGFAAPQALRPAEGAKMVVIRVLDPGVR